MQRDNYLLNNIRFQQFQLRKKFMKFNIIVFSLLNQQVCVDKDLITVYFILINICTDGTILIPHSSLKSLPTIRHIQIKSSCRPASSDSPSSTQHRITLSTSVP